MTRDEFFTALENGAKWDIGVAINRTNPTPIDANSVFKTLNDLQTYAETNPVAHPGQIVAVVAESETAAYIINTTGVGAQVSKLAASTAGDIGEAVSQLQTQVANIISGSQVVGEATKASQDGNGNVISETYATKDVASGDAAGLMSSADKTKLDNIAAGAQVNVIEGVQVQATTGGGYTDLSIVGKKAQLDLSNYATKQDLTTIPKFSIEVVDELPTDDISETTIYLVPSDDPGAQNAYDEFIRVEGAWEKIGSTAVDLSGYSTTEQMNTAISNAVQALDVEPVAVGAGETLLSVSQTDGKIAATKQSIQIGISQVTDLQTQLDAKLEAGDLPTSFEITATSNDFTAQGGDNSVTINLKQSASSVTGQLTKTLDGGRLDFGGEISANGVVLTANQGTVTSITAGEGLTTGGSPITGAGTISLEATGASDQSTSNEGRYYVQNITIDDYGRVTAVSSAQVPEDTDTVREIKVNGAAFLGNAPGTALDLVAGNNVTLTPDIGNGTITISSAAPAYTGAEGISVSGSTIGIEDGGVTNEKIAAVDVAKLYVAEGDTFILNGGNA